MIHLALITAVLVVGSILHRARPIGPPPGPHPHGEGGGADLGLANPGEVVPIAAAQAGDNALTQAIKLDRYQRAERRHLALTNLKAELASTITIVEGNLVEIRKLLLARWLGLQQDRQSSLEALEDDIAKMEARIAGEQVPRNKEILEDQLKRKTDSRAKMLEDLESCRLKSQHYRFMFDEMPDIEGDISGYLGYVDLHAVPLPVWESIAASAHAHEIDAALVRQMTRLGQLARGLEEQMADHRNFNQLQPLRIKGSIWDAARREDQLMEMQRLIGEGMPQIEKLLERLAEVMKANSE